MVSPRKLWLELSSLWSSLLARGDMLVEPARRRRHDAWRTSLAVLPDLGVPLGRKVAVLLLYQPEGIAGSVLQTLRYLIRHGYAPFVISNAPVSGADRAVMAPLVWRMLVRPNNGYDFGGYRDGILLLKGWGITPDRLLILNDSIWCPLYPDSRLIGSLESMAADIAGGILIPPAPTSRKKSTRAGHLQSYLYLIGKPAFEHPAFVDFWESYPLSNQKRNAVRRGERDFSFRMRQAGLRLDGLFTAAGLIEALRHQSTPSLRLTLKYGAYLERADADESAALLARCTDTAQWRAEVVEHVRSVSSRRLFNASFPYAATRFMGIYFMKKTTKVSGRGAVPLNDLMRQRFYAALQAGDLPGPDPVIWEEIVERMPRQTPPQ